jgi:transposase
VSGWSVSARASSIRSAPLFLERGIAVRQGRLFLRGELPGILAAPSEVLSPRMARIIEDLVADWRQLDERIDRLSSEIELLARRDAGCERLMHISSSFTIVDKLGAETRLQHQSSSSCS